jgi:serine phosphatase RsbU (regulator of sigma subunit)
MPNSHPDPTADRPVDPAGYLRAMKRTNDYIARNHSQDAMFATAFFGVLDPASGSLWYINAGHEPLYIVVRSGQIRINCPPPARPWAYRKRLSTGPTHFTMMPGEMLMGYTDGVIDARSPEDEMFSRLRLRAICWPSRSQRPRICWNGSGNPSSVLSGKRPATMT